MIIHSVAPLSCLVPAQDEAPMETLEVGGATLSGRRTAQGFVVSRVVSTDPAAYLNAAYAPGSIVRPEDDARLSR